MKHLPGEARKGFTLLEMLAVMGALAAATGLGCLILSGGLQTEKAATIGHRRLVQRDKLADQFRGDVAQALTMPDRFELGTDKATAGPACLILARPDKREVVYLWTEGRLWRWEKIGAKLSRQPVTEKGDCKGIDFSRGSGDRPVITLRLKLGGPTGVGERSSELAAVLGGDLR